MLPTLRDVFPRRALDDASLRDERQFQSEETFFSAQNSERSGDYSGADRLYGLIEDGVGVPEGVRDRAAERRAILAGEGRGWAQWHFDARALITRADVANFAGLLVGALAFRGAFRLAEHGLAGFLTPLGRRIVPAAAGFLAESFGFALASRGANRLGGAASPWTAGDVARDWLGAMIFLGPMHIGGLLAGRLAPALAGPIRARYPRDYEFASATFNWHFRQQGLFLGAMASQQLEIGLGWREPRPYGEMLLTGALRLLQFNLAEAAGNRTLGAR